MRSNVNWYNPRLTQVGVWGESERGFDQYNSNGLRWFKGAMIKVEMTIRRFLFQLEWF